MVVIIVVFCILAAFLGVYTEQKIMNPLTTFEMMFCLICIGASMQLFGLYGAKDTTYMVVALGVLFYAMGYLSCKKVRIKTKSDEYYTFSFNYKLIYVLGALALTYLVSSAGIAVSYLLRGYSLTYIRFSLFGFSESEYYARSALQYSFRYYVVQPITSILPIFSIVDIFYGKRDKILFVIAIISLLLTIVTSGGRLPILYLIVNILVLLSCTQKKINLSKKVKRRVGVSLAFLAIIILYITLARGVTDIISNYYKYFVGCIPHLDMYLDKINSQHYRAYGASTLKSPIQVFLLALRILHIIPNYPEWFNNLASYTDMRTVVYIGAGENMRYNGFVTIFYYFFLDFGYVSVAIASFVFGIASNSVYTKARKKINVKNLAYLCMLFQVIIVSFARFELSIPHYFIAALLIPLCCRKEYRNANIQKNSLA